MSFAKPSILRFAPLYQERVWGGRNLAKLYGRSLPKDSVPYGESWEICDRQEAQSKVLSGPFQGKDLHELWTDHREEIFGPALIGHSATRFPLLIKILDAEEDLSIQVHPDDESASRVKGEAKSEAWYIAHAAEGAKIYAGLRTDATRDSFSDALDDGSVADQVNVLAATHGDCVAIPGGIMHAIGAGLVIFEIQQNSDTTYRVFDWNRVGLDGKPRELHKDEALEVTHFHADPVTWQPNKVGCLLDWEYFKLDVAKIEDSTLKKVPLENAFVIGAVVSGEIAFGEEKLLSGDFFLVPASLDGDERVFQSPTGQAEVMWVTM